MNKKKLFNWLFALGLISLSSISIFMIKEERIDVHGTVYARYDNPYKNYKSNKVTSEFIMVIKTDEGHLFDLNVTPSTFASCPEGSRVSFKDLRFSEVYPTKNNDKLIWTMLLALSITTLIMWPVGIAIFKEGN